MSIIHKNNIYVIIKINIVITATLAVLGYNELSWLRFKMLIAPVPEEHSSARGHVNC